MAINHEDVQDFILVGAGIMSATLGVFIKKLVPNSRITIFEKLDKPALESTDSWNNAGTGHSAFCELNYTPEKTDGSISVDKALEIASDFEVSRQFWAYLKNNNILKQTEPFISKVPHISFVWGEQNISFLKRRYEAMTKYTLFEDMKYSEDFDEIASWIPLMMKNRDINERIAATWMEVGTDVNFDVITKGLIDYLKSCQEVEVHFNHSVKDLIKQPNGSWKVVVKNLKNGKKISKTSSFVFLGAGGGAFPLLQKSGIKEGKGYGGFPVSGMFYSCKNEEIINQHYAKVYGKAAEGSPPMSMPHLDQRVINGKKSLLFGPYAGISSKFMKNGSVWDLPKSFRMHNIYPMLAAGWHNLNLIGYLIGQATQSKKSRFATLKKYYPGAKPEDWDLYVAGQRVQIMKRDAKEGGVLKLGTEIIASEDKSIAALLGASPGASTSVSAMLDVLKKCFPEKMASEDWTKTLKEMIPSYSESLITNQMLCKDVRNTTGKVLNIL